MSIRTSNPKFNLSDEATFLLWIIRINFVQFFSFSVWARELKIKIFIAFFVCIESYFQFSCLKLVRLDYEMNFTAWSKPAQLWTIHPFSLANICKHKHVFWCLTLPGNRAEHRNSGELRMCFGLYHVCKRPMRSLILIIVFVVSMVMLPLLHHDHRLQLIKSYM